jgi:DNA-binding transcriptional ArsR family regulator
MEHLRFYPLNPRQEAAAVLSRLAYRGDNERSGDMRTSIEYYVKKYNVEPRRFAGILEAYEHVKARLSCDEQELLTLFGMPEGMEANLYDLLLQIRLNLGDERVHDLNLRIALFLSDEADEPVFNHAGVSDLMAYTQRLPNPDSVKLLLSDAIIRFEEYEARANRILDQAEALLREKIALLEPYAAQMLASWNALPKEEAFFDRLAVEGIRLDCPCADVYPAVMQFTTVAIHSNAICAERFGNEERSIISYGIFVDEFTDSDRTGKTDLESIANLLHALDDKKRLQILLALRSRPLYGQELASLTELSPGTVSHHMSELAGCGLVTIEKQGVKLLYHLNEARLREFTAMVEKNLLH